MREPKLTVFWYNQSPIYSHYDQFKVFKEESETILLQKNGIYSPSKQLFLYSWS